MRIASTVLAVFAAAVVSGCSNTAAIPRPASADARPDNFGTHLVAVSDSEHGVVNIYNEATKELAHQLTGLVKPGALATDALDNLYVIQSGGRDIRIYRDMYGTYGTFHDAGNVARGIAYSYAYEAVAVTNNCTVAKSCPPYSGSIDYYADGNNWICHIPVPNYRYVGYGDFDPNGNFYFNGTTGSGRVVVSQIARGTECNVPAKYTALTTGNTIQSVGNVRFGTYGLSLLDPKAKVIYNYGLPKNGALGTPKSVTSLGGSGTIASAGFTYTLSRTSIFTTDSSSATANRYLMPLGGNPKETISVGGVPSGIAVGSESR